VTSPAGLKGRPRAPPIGGCSAGTLLAHWPPCPRACSGWPRSAGSASGRLAPWIARVPPGTGGGEGGALAATAQASSSSPSRRPLGCRWPYAPRPRTGMSGLRSSRCWIACTSAPGNQADRARGMRPQLPTRLWKRRKPRGRPVLQEGPRDQAERPCAWLQRPYRRRAVRWARLAICFTAFLAMAMVHLWVHGVRVR
jgi:hypothetical protein